MADCKGEGKVKGQIFLKKQTFNFAINDHAVIMIAHSKSHKQDFDPHPAIAP